MGFMHSAGKGAFQSEQQAEFPPPWPGANAAVNLAENRLGEVRKRMPGR